MDITIPFSICTSLALDSAHCDILEKDRLKLIVPRRQLARGSVQIIHTSYKKLSDWEKQDHEAAFDLILRTQQIWKERGINNYLIYGKDGGESPFSWEIVPYSLEGGRFWKQFKVLWNTTFGGINIPQVEKEILATDLKTELSTKEEHPLRAIAQENIPGTDPFCNENIISKQLILEGREINLLYNYAPLEKYHFLLIPKKHRGGFHELTSSEYLEVNEMTNALIDLYKDKGYSTVFAYDKTGKEAGQVVPHWHRHIVFTAAKTEECWGRLTIFKNMLFGAAPLSESALRERVHSIKQLLQTKYELFGVQESFLCNANLNTKNV